MGRAVRAALCETVACGWVGVELTRINPFPVLAPLALLLVVLLLLLIPEGSALFVVGV